VNYFYFKSAVLFTAFFVTQQAVAEDIVVPVPATVETLTTDAATTNTVSGDASVTDAAATAHDPLIVTATRTPQTIAQALAPATVITREEIENSQAQSLPELLQGLPGIDLTTQGGPGKSASLYLRGTGTGHTLFMIDGVRIGSATSGTTSIELIPLEQIDHIEIVRGPRSSLYGSDAIGGVIQIFSRKGSDKTRVTAKVGHGTYNTHEADAGISGNAALGHFSLHAAAKQTDGINVLDNNNPDKDGYKNHSLTAAFNRSLGDISDISLNILHSNAKNEYDGSDITSQYLGETTQNIVSSEFKLYPIDALDSAFHLSHQQDKLDIFNNGTNENQYDTLRNQFTWQNNYHLNTDNIFTLGYDKLVEKVETSDAYTVTERDNRAVFGQIQSGFAQQNIVLALRSDNNEAFGHHRTGSIDWRWNFADNANITAAYGRAFKAPTFTDLYYPLSGNPNLLPQESRSSEIMTRIKTGNTEFSLNLYRTQTENLIEWMPISPGSPIWAPFNLTVTIEGMETEVTTKIDEWTLRGNINLVNPHNDITDTVLQLRARQIARIDLDRNYGFASVGVSLLTSGKRFADPYNLEELPGYGLVNLRGRYDLSKTLSLHAKIDNLLDREYETVQYYNNPTRFVFVSLSYNME
jgi:vitamin B12 transporter